VMKEHREMILLLHPLHRRLRLRRRLLSKDNPSYLYLGFQE
jgi:hypothetical protein